MENKINGLLAGQLSSMDETDLEAELNALMSNDASNMNSNNINVEVILPKVPITPILPQAPSSIKSESNIVEKVLA